MKKNAEKNKKLSEAEKRRLEKFEKLSDELQQQGYIRHDLTIDIVRANIFAIILLILLFIIGYGIYFLVHRSFSFSGFNMLLSLLVFVILIVVHELIHGLSWGFFTPNHLRDIEFGFMKTSMTPYCACLVPLKKGQYLFGAVMPLIILGIIPMAVGIVTGYLSLLFIGILMADGAAGDIMIIQRILQYKSNENEIIYMDHPTEAGGVVFERQD